MSNIARITRAAQQQSMRQGTQLDDLLPRLDGEELELAETMQRMINNARRQEQRGNDALRQLGRAEGTIAALQEDKDRLHRQLDAAESRAHAAETR